ncbi:hypothetical protein SRHO_G00126930 [Serrasalmus rhombeus]
MDASATGRRLPVEGRYRNPLCCEHTSMRADERWPAAPSSARTLAPMHAYMQPSKSTGGRVHTHGRLGSVVSALARNSAARAAATLLVSKGVREGLTFTGGVAGTSMPSSSARSAGAVTRGRSGSVTPARERLKPAHREDVTPHGSLWSGSEAEYRHYSMPD